MEPRRWKSTATYVGLLSLAFAGGVAASYLFGPQLDNRAYDKMFLYYQPPPWKLESVIVGIDEVTLAKCGGLPGIREPLARGLRNSRAASQGPAHRRGRPPKSRRGRRDSGRQQIRRQRRRNRQRTSLRHVHHEAQPGALGRIAEGSKPV
ncbi:exported hypothetical protein [Candidatus Sulfopaludibacter sp. SbA3]|nr:exported hypothetical protein [Candidatus Sulfopaludibacter sp. SbA3]